MSTVIRFQSALRFTPGLKSMHIYAGEGTILVLLRFKWWTWFACGLWHKWAKGRAAEALELQRPAVMRLKVEAII